MHCSMKVNNVYCSFTGILDQLNIDILQENIGFSTRFPTKFMVEKITYKILRNCDEN